MSKQFITDIKVVYGSAPGDAVKEIDGRSNNISEGFGKTEIYVIPVYTTHATQACNRFGVVVQNGRDPNRLDLAKGAGGAFRYLLPFCNPQTADRICALGLLRSSEAVGTPPEGYTGMTSDINKDRGGSYLYLVWKSENVTRDNIYSSGLKVVHGFMPSREPVGAITDINNGGDHINQGYGGSYVWLVGNYTNDPDSACTAYSVAVQGLADDSKADLASGAGGDFRYVLGMRSLGVPIKLTEVRLLRSSNPVNLQALPEGYYGMSGDINRGRKGTYLYLIWRAQETARNTWLLSTISFQYGSMPSQQSPECITEYTTPEENNINAGSRGAFSWLAAKYTKDPQKACTGLSVVTQSNSNPQQADLAKGTGGNYRHLITHSDAHNPKKLTTLHLLRSPDPRTSPPVGYDGISSDLNAGRGGSYLYLIWMTS